MQRKAAEGDGNQARWQEGRRRIFFAPHQPEGGIRAALKYTRPVVKDTCVVLVRRVEATE